MQVAEWLISLNLNVIENVSMMFRRGKVRFIFNKGKENSIHTSYTKSINTPKQEEQYQMNSVL